MENSQVVSIAQAILSQKVAKYSQDEIGDLLVDLQRTFTRFCDSFCDWLLMESPRFSLFAEPGPHDAINLRVVLHFPPPESETELEASAGDVETEKLPQDE